MVPTHSPNAESKYQPPAGELGQTSTMISQNVAENTPLDMNSISMVGGVGCKRTDWEAWNAGSAFQSSDS